MQRYRDFDVAAEEARAGTTFFEFDMDRGPLMAIPGAWNAARPELRYYDCLKYLTLPINPWPGVPPRTAVYTAGRPQRRATPKIPEPGPCRFLHES